MGRKHIRAALGICAAALFLAEPQSGEAQGQQTLVIQGGTLIDGNGGAPVVNSVVVVEGNRITAVGAAGQVDVPAGARVIDASGKWVLPGLIDAKANYNWPYGEAFIHYGVTSAMISGPRGDQGLAERDAINHGIYEGPRLFQTVVGIRGPGVENNRSDNHRVGNVNRVAETGEQAAQFARDYRENGADFITFTDGYG
ncbi:MAG: amidohydrolase family protein, partial [Alphaproteobacteria bacterium]